MKPDICLFHSPCIDGFSAAWAVWSCYGDDVTYLPGVYGQDPPDVTDKHVLLVDFSYKRPVLERMAQSAASITVLDHHKSAMEDLTPPPEGVNVVFDMGFSGAVLAWQFCHREAPTPRLLEYVQDRDLWRFELPGSREVHAVTSSHPYDFDTWDWLAARCDHAMSLQEMINEGAGIERKHRKDVLELMNLTRREMIIGGFRVPVANMPYTMAPDAAGFMAEGQPFAATYYDRPDARVFSLRSRGEFGMDVSKVAIGYGGGGHLRSAGFQAPLGWEGDDE